MADFHFLRPFWLWLLPALILILLVRRRQRLHNAKAWRAWVDLQLLPHLLLAGEARTRQGPIWLAGVAGILATLALAGPVWDKVQPPRLRPAAPPLMVVLDLSRSMDAADPAPSRLNAARVLLRNLLDALPPRPLGLVVFAAGAHRALPLTEDRELFLQLLQTLESDLMPRQGSNPAAGLMLAQRLLDQAEESLADVLLITDHSGPGAREAASALRGKQRQLLIVGVGTSRGGTIPDFNGESTLVRLDLIGLHALAEAGGGHFLPLHSLTGSPEASILSQLSQGRAQRQAQEVPNTEAVWRERGPWLLLPMLPLVLFGFRRGWLGLFALVLFVPPQPVFAWSWEDLWLNQAQLAKRALDQGYYEQAARGFNDPVWQGVAHFRQGDLAAALDRFSRADTALAHYNRGTTFARSGQLHAAIEAYDKALRLNPNHRDAQYNRQRIMRFLQRRSLGIPAPSPDRPQSAPQPDIPRTGTTTEELLAVDPETLHPSLVPESEEKQPSLGALGGGAILLRDTQPDRGPEGNGQGQSGGGDGQTDSGPVGAGTRATAPVPAKGSKPVSRAEPEIEAATTEQIGTLHSPADTTTPPSGAAGTAPAKESSVQTDSSDASDQRPTPPEGIAGDGSDHGDGDASGRTAEQRSAIEHWLQRIPDDPGGLLRELFRREHRRGQDHSVEGPPW